MSIVFGGGLLDATLELAFVHDSLTAVLKLGEHDSPVKAGKRSGNKLTLEPKSAGWTCATTRIQRRERQGNVHVSG